MKSDKNCLKRREFLRKSIAGAAASVPVFSIIPRHVLGGPGEFAPSEKLNIACIGVGGRGAKLANHVCSQNIVALCDVDEKRAGGSFGRFPDARRYRDFRRMLDREEKNIDAVVIASTDHTHIPASVMAMRMGKHVYCEKPLGQNVHEVRLATKVARETGVATQMGNGAHSGYNYRSLVKLIKDGTIGEVREAHCWCDQTWPPGDRPNVRPPVPPHLRWDLWLGPAPVRPYHPTYHPMGWRQWWDFGNARLGDMGCHMIDLPFSALDLKYPTAVEAHSAGPAHKESGPPWLISKWTFPARGDLPPVALTWYDGNGNKRPPPQKQYNMPDWPEGTILVGSKGMLIADYGRFRLYPEEKFKGLPRPHVGENRSHMDNWIRACKLGDPTLAGCQFEFSGPLTETVLLGIVAFRAGEKLEWDAKNMKVTNCADANRFTQREHYRKGWEI